MGAEHRPYFAALRTRDSDALPSEVAAVQALLSSPGWALLEEIIDTVHGNAVDRLLFASTGSEGRVLEQAEYARLLGFLAGLGQARVAAESFIQYAERVRTKEEK